MELLIILSRNGIMLEEVSMQGRISTEQRLQTVAPVSFILKKMCNKIFLPF